MFPPLEDRSRLGRGTSFMVVGDLGPASLDRKTEELICFGRSWRASWPAVYFLFSRGRIWLFISSTGETILYRCNLGLLP